MLFANKYEQIGLPSSPTRTGTRSTPRPRTLELSVNFHVGFVVDARRACQAADRSWARPTSTPGRRPGAPALGIMGNADCHREHRDQRAVRPIPARSSSCRSRAVSGTSPYLLDSLDWHWRGYGAHLDRPAAAERVLPPAVLRHVLVRDADAAAARDVSRTTSCSRRTIPTRPPWHPGRTLPTAAQPTT